MRKLLVNDLFTGVGGMALGLERTGGFKIISMCEVLPSRQTILKRHWPKMTIYPDVFKLKAKDMPDSDWIVGGPPCHRTSIAAAIHGYWTGETLWPQMHRILKEKRPHGTIVEQPNRHEDWKRKVQRDLEKLGYEVSRYVIEASSVGAIHTRERVFFVAHRYGKRLALPGSGRPPEIERYARAAATGSHWDKPPRGLLRLDDGIRARMDSPAIRKLRIRAAGSSCVPQVAQVLGMIILGGFHAA